MDINLATPQAYLVLFNISLHNTYRLMIKYILPAIIVILIVVFWEKITEAILKKFNIRLNYIIVSAVLIIIAIIILLINF